MGEQLLFHLCVTLAEVAAAFFFGVLFSLTAVLCMHFLPKTKRYIESVLVFFQAVPLFILSPLLILVFGFTHFVVILPTALMLTFPLAIALYKGIESTPSSFIRYHRALGLNWFHMFFHIRLPFALPAVFSGIRVAASAATLGVLASEWAGGQSGLGVFIQEMRRNYDLTGVFVGISITFILSALLYGAIACLEQYFSSRFSFVSQHSNSME